MDEQPKELAPGILPDDRVVLFDGVCVMCAAWAQFLIKYDTQRRFQLATVQSPEGQAILEFYGFPTDEYKTMMVVDGPRMYTKTSAFFRVMRGLPFPWPLVCAGLVVPRFIRDWLYDRIASNRYKLFGQHEFCMLPTEDHEARMFRGEAASPQ